MPSWRDIVAKDLDNYLNELQSALRAAGADPALVQDALFDAEEYLRAEMAERHETAPASVDEYQTRFAAVVESYGAPEEVAAAYLGAPRVDASAAPVPPESEAAPVPPAPAGAPIAAAVLSGGVAGAAGVAAGAAAGAARPSALRQVFGVVVDPAVYKALLYMLLSLGTGIVYFTVTVTGISTAGGMLVLIIGIPLFLLVLGLVRGMALMESRLVEALLGTRMPRRERAELPEAGWLQRVGFWVRDGRTWASMAYMILMLPLGAGYFTLAVTGLSVGFGLIGSPFGFWARDQQFVWHGVDYAFSLPGWSMPFAVIAGLGLVLLLLHLIRWIGRCHASFAKSMLVRLAR
jgi:hypothetical protein